MLTMSFDAGQALAGIVQKLNEWKPHMLVLAVETSDHNGMYIYEDNVILEVVDDQYSPMPWDAWEVARHLAQQATPPNGAGCFALQTI